MPATQFEKTGEFHKTSGGIAYGWAVVSTIDGTPYQDLQGDYIPADTIPDVAADFMARARVGKDMHAGDQVADVIFAWPATDEINKGVEYSGRKTGLLIGWRPYDKALLDKIAAGERVGFSIGGELHESDTEAVGKFSKAVAGAATAQRRTFRAWKLNEISLVDFPAQEPALVGVVKSASGAAKYVIASAIDKAGKRKPKRKKPAATPPPAGTEPYKRVGKIAVLTSITDGHQHTINLEDPACSWSDSLSTSYQTAEGATEGHSHAWVYDAATGAITIALDSGHTHTTDAVVPADVLAAAAADDDESDAIPTPCCDEPSSGKTAAPTVVVVNSRAPAGVSPPAAATPTVKTTEEPMTTDPNDKIRDLTAENARLQKMCTLTDAQRVHYEKLKGGDADNYLNLTPSQREGVLIEIEKSDEIVYTAVDGTKYRKSQPVEVINAAKATDAMNSTLNTLKIKEQNLGIAKRGADLFKSAPEGARGDLKERLMRGIESEFVKTDERDEAIQLIKQYEAARVWMTKAIGHDGSGRGPEANGPEQQLRTAVEKYQADNKLPSYELALLKATESDANIRKLYDAAS